MMKAIEFTFGSDDRKVVEIAIPEPAEGEILVKIVNSALDTSFDQVRSKSFDGSFIHKLKNPLYLGYHFSGVVKKLGPNVLDYQLDDAVFGFLGYKSDQTQGAFSEYITVKTTSCARKPSSMSHALAAACSTEALTALQALRDHGKLAASGRQQRVLVVGAAGGVGSAAVGIAKCLGDAHVTALCSAKDMEYVKEFGADVVLDRQKHSVDSLDNNTFDVIFDTPVVSGLPFGKLKRNGTLVVTGLKKITSFIWGNIVCLFSSKNIKLVVVQDKKEDLEMVAKWIVEDKLRIDIDSTFDIKDLGKALEKHSGKKKGRVVIRVEGGWA